MADDSTIATLKLAERELQQLADEPRRFSPLDTTVDIITPENIAFNYRTAGPFRRFWAFLIDLCLIVVILVVLVVLLFLVMYLLSLFAIFTGSFQAVMAMGATLWAIIVVSGFVLFWFYGGLFETYMNGQTPGKRMLGIRVLTTEGKPINGLQAVLRTVLRLVESWPWLSLHALDQFYSEPFVVGLLIVPTFIVGIVAMASNRRFQRVGDLVCGTMVVMEERHWLTGVAQVEDPRAPKLAEYLPPKFEVSRSLARALATYVERRRYFSIPRRREIARHLGEPLVRVFGLPHDTSHDLLLCALYYKAFVADREEEPDDVAYGQVVYAEPPSAAAEEIVYLSPHTSPPQVDSGAPPWQHASGDQADR